MNCHLLQLLLFHWKNDHKLVIITRIGAWIKIDNSGTSKLSYSLKFIKMANLFILRTIFYPAITLLSKVSKLTFNTLRCPCLSDKHWCEWANTMNNNVCNNLPFSPFFILNLSPVNTSQKMMYLGLLTKNLAMLDHRASYHTKFTACSKRI